MSNNFIGVSNNYFTAVDDIRSIRVCTKGDVANNNQFYQLKIFYKDGQSCTIYSSDDEKDVRERLNSIVVNGSINIL